MTEITEISKILGKAHGPIRACVGLGLRAEDLHKWVRVQDVGLWGLGL